VAEFLTLLPPGEALARLLGHLPPPGEGREEWLDTQDALERVSAQRVLAEEMLPGFARATVDGFAARARDTFGAAESLPAYLALVGEVPMGSAPDFSLAPGQAALIHTGGMLPAGADTVVMLEHTQVSRPGEMEVLRAAAPGENVLLAGEDLRPGEEVLTAGERISPARIGGLMALGITRVAVVRRPFVGLISSGDEVVPPTHPAAPGQVRDVNSYTLAALVQRCGGEARRYGIAPDSRAALEALARRALVECDVVVITAGSSASARDMTAEVIAVLGEPGVLVHGVNVRPGKPTILAVCAGKAVVGLPGNPVSALVIADLFVRPLIERLLGLGERFEFRQVRARLSASLPSQAGRADFVPVALHPDPEGWTAEPIFYKSNLIFTLARADGLAHIPADANGIAAGEWVEVTRI
jgi:molybdopterin molybdotransferase